MSTPLYFPGGVEWGPSPAELPGMNLPLGLLERNTSRIPLEGGAEEEQEHFSLGVLKLSLGLNWFPESLIQSRSGEGAVLPGNLGEQARWKGPLAAREEYFLFLCFCQDHLY